MKFADPKSDIAFKKIFGDERRKDILIGFLNAVLGLEGECAVKDVTITNPLQSPRIERLKETTLDIRAVDHRNVNFIIEMQVEKQEYFAKRALYYTSKAYIQQIKQAVDYPKLNAVYFIGILDFSLLSGKEALSRHLIINQNSQEQDIKDVEFNFIELPKFTKKLEELDNVIDRWMYFFKHTDELSTVPEKLSEIKEIKEALEVVDQHLWTEEEINVYDYWSMKEGGELDAINTAKKEGLKEGLKEGREEGIKEGEEKGEDKGLKKGRKEEKIEMAKNCLKKGLSVDLVVDLTGLYEEDVKTLQREI